MKIDHVGYAVKSIEKAKGVLEEMGYVIEQVIRDESRGVDILFGELDGYRVELIAPFRDESPIDKYLSEIGPTPYHICYQSDDLEDDIARLKGKRFSIAVPPAPATAFDGRRVVFMYSLAVGLIEIVEN